MLRKLLQSVPKVQLAPSIVEPPSTMSAPERRPTRGKPALVAAAAQENNGPVTADQAASGLSAGTTVPSTSTARPAVNRIHLSSASAQVGPDPGSASTVGSTSHPNAPMAFPGLTGTSYSRAPSIASVGSGGAVSVRSTPTIPESSQVGGETVTRMKFKPKVPIRRVKQYVLVCVTILSLANSAASLM